MHVQIKNSVAHLQDLIPTLAGTYKIISKNTNQAKWELNLVHTVYVKDSPGLSFADLTPLKFCRNTFMLPWPEVLLFIIIKERYV